jgi:hypothetical protein
MGFGAIADRLCERDTSPRKGYVDQGRLVYAFVINYGLSVGGAVIFGFLLQFGADSGIWATLFAGDGVYAGVTTLQLAMLAQFALFIPGLALSRINELVQFIALWLWCRVRNQPTPTTFLCKPETVLFPYANRDVCCVLMVSLAFWVPMTLACVLIVPALLISLWIDRYTFVAMARQPGSEVYQRKLLLTGAMVTVGSLYYTFTASVIGQNLLVQFGVCIGIVAATIVTGLFLRRRVQIFTRRRGDVRFATRSIHTLPTAQHSLSAAGAAGVEMLNTRLLDGWAPYELEALALAYRPPDTVPHYAYVDKRFA